MPTYEHEIPARKVRITITTEHVGEVEGWQDRLAAVEKVLRKLVRDPIDGSGGLPVTAVLPEIARDLARHWEMAGRYPTPQRHVVETVRKIQKLARGLVESKTGNLADAPIHGNGLSLEMVQALLGAAYSDIFADRAKPARGRSANRGALRLAEAFATHYPWLTGREPGVNAEHDFVKTLGVLFDALGFKAKPQYYAKLAVDALAPQREAMRQDQAARERVLESLTPEAIERAEQALKQYTTE